MFNMSDNYYLREHYLNSKEIPTQSLIKKKMTPPLADIYFKSMNKNLTVMVGLEPPLKGGGGDWYVPPKDLLDGRAVLKPLKKKYLSKLTCEGIESVGQELIKTRLKLKKEEKERMIKENDEKWKAYVESECQRCFTESSNAASMKNTERIRAAVNEFSTLFASSFNNIEDLVISSTKTEIMKVQNAAYEQMSEKYTIMVKQQATELYELYKDKLLTEKLKLKTNFIHDLDEKRNELKEKMHDINVEKHMAIEKVRQYLASVNIACQIYVALKEKEECGKILDELTRKHKKKVGILTEDISSKDVEIILHMEREKKRQEIRDIWQKKVNHVVQKFQLFVTYCLSTLPEHADFFINMERLMLLQLSEVLDNPSAESIFEVEQDIYAGPSPKPHPYYLFCDKGEKYKINVNQDLCPKRCTSSASHLPVIVVNKRFMYGACDNFEQFSYKTKCFIYGSQRGDDDDFVDQEIYDNYVPVKYTSSQQLRELKLESSIMQVLNQENPNLKEVPTNCGFCKIPYCFCTYPQVPTISANVKEEPKKMEDKSPNVLNVGKSIDTKHAKLEHERQPKWESYSKYLETKKCKCYRTTKKNLMEHLPAYMRQTSVYTPTELPNYETCSLTTLKFMVKQARGTATPSTSTHEVRAKDMGTQCMDIEFEFLCECLSDEEIINLLKGQITGSKMYDRLIAQNKFQLVTNSVSEIPPSVTTGPRISTVEAIKQNLKHHKNDTLQLKEIFKTTRSFD